MTVAIVCGGRDYADAARVARVLDAAVVKLGVDMIVHGKYRGADTLAGDWAAARGDISVIECPADWDGLGDGAGPARNELMASMLMHLPPPDKVCIAFAGQNGTADMKRRAAAHGIRVIEA